MVQIVLTSVIASLALPFRRLSLLLLSSLASLLMQQTQKTVDLGVILLHCGCEVMHVVVNMSFGACGLSSVLLLLLLLLILVVMMMIIAMLRRMKKLWLLLGRHHHGRSGNIVGVVANFLGKYYAVQALVVASVNRVIGTPTVATVIAGLIRSLKTKALERVPGLFFLRISAGRPFAGDAS
jgi:hypothetical protein